MSINIFAIEFENILWENLAKQCEIAFETQKNLRITTVNPEYLLEARKNLAFAESLKQADARLVDGFGILLVAWLRGERLARLTGADVLPKLLAWAEESQVPVVIYNKPGSLSSESDCEKALKAKYPRLLLTHNVPSSTYHLALCTHGAPEQEFFLDQLKQPGIKIGVGGALDFLTQKQKRAPQWMRKIGCEWLWRLFWQPKRIVRILRAVFLFPLYVILEVFIYPHGR